MSATDAEKAAVLREAADLLDEGGFSGAAMDAREAADELDPPAPVYPEGTIARARPHFGLGVEGVAVRQGGRWRFGLVSYQDADFEVLEVIPTLPPGHVAVKVGLPSETLRSAAGQLKRQFYLSTAEMLDEIAAAQEVQ